MLSFAITTLAVQADEFHFIGSKGADNWDDVNNWNNITNPEKRGIPGAADKSVIQGGRTLKLTNTVTVGYFRNGVDGVARGASSVIIDGGTLNTVGDGEWNSITRNCATTVIIKNGGVATFKSRLVVGYMNTGSGALIIQEGTVRVEDTFCHHEHYDGTEPLNVRTTIHSGGLLDVDKLILNAGVLDLAGGTLVIRKGAVSEVDQWVASGRIVAMGGAEGWSISNTVNPETGWVTVQAAEPSGKTPIIVGAVSPSALRVIPPRS